jgi:hypothetical protein
MGLINQIILKDNTTLDCISILGRRQFISGSDRDSIIFNFDSNVYKLDDIYSLFNNSDNTSEIIIRQTETSDEEDKEPTVTEFYHYDYSIFTDLKIYDETVTEETNTEATITNRLISVTMGQKTYTEKALDEKNEQIDAMCEVMSDILGGAE